ncbi:MAG TPA: MMPL family transporter [Gaiellaceae bacterium]|nr:MMPL family transporter [Gaiellaceae bacterium]
MSRIFSSAVVRLRYLVLAGWIAAAVATTVYLPGLGSGEPLELGGLVPDDSPAVQAGVRSQELFSVPLIADTAVVERDPGGLSADEQTGTFDRAVDATTQDAEGDEIALALPILNTQELFPGSEEDGTTAVTHLFFSGGSSLSSRVGIAQEYAARSDVDGFAGVTGPAPARLAQFEEIEDALPLVEAATVAVIALVVGLTFRSLGAPLLTLVAAGIAFLVSRGLIPWVGERLGAGIPQEVEPLVVALTLGVATDYAIFFLAACRRRLAAGEERLEAARRSSTIVAPIVTTAGLIVVTGTAALVVGELEFFRAFGPALAITAAVALVVSVTFVPAGLAVLGRAAFWPSLERRGGDAIDPESPTQVRSAASRFLTSRPVSALVALATVAVLLAAATGLRDTKLGMRLGSGLPADSEVQQAAEAAAQGFAPGVLAPALVLVEGEAVAERRDELARLEEAVREVPGVAGTLGPGRIPAEVDGEVMVSEDGNAARLAVIVDDPPLDSGAIETVNALDERLPELLQESGLGEHEAALAGQTAIAADTVEGIVDSSVLVGAVVLALNVILLAVFLRAVVAPLYLVAASVLSVAATLGLTTYFFQGYLGHSDLTYYVPFAAGVLLVSLGSDYNVFVAGRIWQEAGRRPLREAIAVAAPGASRAIGVAGLALALSFAMLALVPVDGFREFAFMMGVGVMLETFLVRPLLIPALVALFGEAGAWPSGRGFGRRRTGHPVRVSGGGGSS